MCDGMRAVAELQPRHYVMNDVLDRALALVELHRHLVRAQAVR